MLENLKNMNLSRDAKVNLAFGGFFTAGLITTIATGGLAAPAFFAAEVIGSAASYGIGAEATKSVLNWLNRRKETVAETEKTVN